MPYPMIANWAVCMVDATESSMPAVIAAGLRDLGMALGATRVLFFGFAEGDTRAVVEVDWAAPGLESAVGAEYS